MRKEAGFTATEVVVAASVVALVMTSAATAALPVLAREKLRSATYELQSILQVSRMEAIARNSPTRFVMNRDTRTIESWDTKGTVGTADDELLRRVALSRAISLARPDTGDAVTMGEEKSSAIQEVRFSADGSAPGGTGEITLYGGGEYRKLDLQAAGSVAVDRWVGDGWEKADALEVEKLEKLWEDARADCEDDWADKLGEDDTLDPPKDDDYYFPDPDDYTGDDGTNVINDPTNDDPTNDEPKL